MKYIKELSVDTEQGDANLQVWFPIPINSISTVKVSSHFSIGGLTSEILPSFELDSSEFEFATAVNEDLGLKIVYLEIPRKKTNYKISIEFEVDDYDVFPPTSEKFLRNALDEETLVDFKSEKIAQMSRIIEERAKSKGVDFITEVKEYLKEKLTYMRDPLTRKASEVADSLTSDCGGYHSLFCALLRSKGVPAVLAFGYRAGYSNNDHTCAFYWKNNSWVREDINDYQNGVSIQPFLVMSFGSGIDIKTKSTPSFPKPIQFIQHSLLWIENFKPNKVKKNLKYIS